MDLNGKIVLVTGGAGGIGLGIAKAFAAEGCRVALAGTTEENLIKAAESAETPSPLLWRTCDVTDREQVGQLFEWLDSELGSVDILVNSAGVNIANRMMANINPAEFDRVMDVNTTGTFNCIHAALPGMRQKGSGLIVNISSVAGKRAMLMAGLPYCVSKFATS
ncbi:MAG: SDR family oxidoreductase, partial [Planctomycetota bacterium]